MNSGAIKLNGKYYLVVRVEGNDRKSFFAVAESDNGIDGFHFWDYPVVLPDTCPEETNVYDMRLTQHEDGSTACSALRAKIRTTATFPRQLQRRESCVPKISKPGSALIT